MKMKEGVPKMSTCWHKIERREEDEDVMVTERHVREGGWFKREVDMVDGC